MGCDNLRKEKIVILFYLLNFSNLHWDAFDLETNGNDSIPVTHFWSCGCVMEVKINIYDQIYFGIWIYSLRKVG